MHKLIFLFIFAHYLFKFKMNNFLHSIKIILFLRNGFTEKRKRPFCSSKTIISHRLTEQRLATDRETDRLKSCFGVSLRTGKLYPTIMSKDKRKIKFGVIPILHNLCLFEPHFSLTHTLSLSLSHCYKHSNVVLKHYWFWVLRCLAEFLVTSQKSHF